MRTGMITVLTILGLLLIPAVPGTASDDSIATPGTREIVAMVNGEEIFMDELFKAVAARHVNMEVETPTAWIGYKAALKRLINTKLIIQEALDVGLGERPEIRERVKRYRDQILVKLVKGRQLLELEPDEDDIERIYRDEVRHWKFRALVFEDLEQGRAFRGELDGEGGFDAVGERYVQDELAVWDGREREVREADVSPALSAAFLGKEVGSVTPVIKALDRFFVFKLTGVSYSEDPDARRRATKKALILKREKVLREYTDQLIEKYVSVDQEVFATIGTSGFTDVEKDSRVLAEIADEYPVLVIDLSRYLKGKFYHGENTSGYGKALQSGFDTVLRDVLEERVYRREARETGIDETDYYRGLVADFENSLVFGTYLEKFLVPQVDVSEEEIKAFYEKRSDEFLLPRKIELDSLTFTEKRNAQKALEGLKRSADFKWLSSNVKGLKEDGVAREELILDTLPQELQTLLAEVQPGDTGLYEPGGDIFKVFVVRAVPPRKVKPLDQVRSRITKELFGKRLSQVIEDLAAELREISEITINNEKLQKGPVPQGLD